MALGAIPVYRTNNLSWVRGGVLTLTETLSLDGILSPLEAREYF